MLLTRCSKKKRKLQNYNRLYYIIILFPFSHVIKSYKIFKYLKYFAVIEKLYFTVYYYNRFPPPNKTSCCNVM